MQNQMLSIFKAITPDNIKNLPIISDSMEIFIELLAENSAISKDIKRSLSEDTTISIAEELPKIYLYDYYSMIENLRTNKNIVNKFKKWNDALSYFVIDGKENFQIDPMGMPVINDRLTINHFLIGDKGQDGTSNSNAPSTGHQLSLKDETDDNINWNMSPLSGKLDILKHSILQNKAENYYINRKFKESKGLKKSIFFIYDIINEHIFNPDERRPLVINETGNPFELNIISGSVDKDIYTQSVAYLAHPLGFTYTYRHISELNFIDEYGLRKVYDVRSLEVRCLNGNIEKYTKEVIYIEDKTNYLKIVFFDGTYLLQENDVVKYFDSNNMIIKVYPPVAHCSIFIDYDIIYKITYDDDIRFVDTSLFVEKEENELSDSLRYKQTLSFKKGFIIGVSIIGEDFILDDVDLYNIVAEGADIVNLGKIGDNSAPDNDEVFNVMDSEEDFSIIGKDTINLSKKCFIIGLSIIGEDFISNNDDLFDVMNAEEDFSIEII